MAALNLLRHIKTINATGFRGLESHLSRYLRGRQGYRYTVQFYRRRGDRDWYDEISYDSHETRKGRIEVSPHFHMKLMSSFKLDVDTAVEEIKNVIDNYVSNISGVIES